MFWFKPATSYNKIVIFDFEGTMWYIIGGKYLYFYERSR